MSRSDSGGSSYGRPPFRHQRCHQLRPRQAPRSRRTREYRPAIVWHLLSDPNARFIDLGADFYDTRIGPERKKRNHARQLEALGYRVILEPIA
ncbi:hypothetical protein ACTWPT_37580 [Nonomuraea sp. 3N208]|uniref:hypothetical protein n=1 Tax=Nonomuraea sp. 3N208 TaxID=3457421 RepID=UPI003FD3FBF9